jgi:hypothetical protein
MPRATATAPATGQLVLAVELPGGRAMSRTPLRAMRRVYWRHVRRYDGEICDRCGRPVGRCTGSWWCAPDALWRDLNGGFAGVMCPPCFTAAAESVGIFVHWEATVE